MPRHKYEKKQRKCKTCGVDIPSKGESGHRTNARCDVCFAKERSNYNREYNRKRKEEMWKNDPLIVDEIDAKLARLLDIGIKRLGRELEKEK